jgi:outer membrane protein assembly factor BamB
VAAVVLLLAAGGLGDRLGDARGGGTGVSDGAVAVPDDDVLAELADRGDPPAPDAPPAGPPVTDPACTRGADLACFRWAHEGPPGGFEQVTVTGDTVLAYAGDAQVLTARDLEAGTVRWSTAVTDGDHLGAPLLVTADLVLLREDRDLVARGLGTGEQRWRTPELGALALTDVTLHDGTLVVAGQDRRAASNQTAAATAVGLDPRTGAVRWRERGLHTVLAAGGSAVVTTGEGHLRAFDPDGTLRWEQRHAVERGRGGAAWADGQVVSLHDGRTGVSLLRLRDGAPLGIDGAVVASDDEVTLLALRATEDGDGPRRGQAHTYVLVDADGERWRTPGGAGSGCLHRVRFAPSTVELTTCAGERVGLDREDGSPAEVGPGGTAAVTRQGASLVRTGPFDLVQRARRTSAQEREVLVLDADSGREVALLPAHAAPVDLEERADDEPVVLVAGRWVVALPAEGDRPRGSVPPDHGPGPFAPSTAVSPR